MIDLQSLLLQKVLQIEGIEARPSPVAGGTALFCRNVEFAHFHNSNEIDLRLTKSKIRELRLHHPKNSINHPTRSVNSAFIELRYESVVEVDEIVKLIVVAAELV